ncbi:glycoside hydrolase family 5 protein [Favolaschia claudopus]|uniref:Glycoside hydrolase family 5 protein n=1 Tax=Favolaschia claudopus TaxID=2862362 RepID=A0AAW0DAH6_9AGAR
MPCVPTVSPATGNPTSSHFIHTADCNFVDNAGRTLLLRGVNLSGSSKAPVDRPSYIREGFWETAESGGESFIGRPLNIDDGSADIHLARLAGWGFNMLRFPVTWEALEHEGPGKYDHEFMDYTVRVLRKCKEYGFRVYMDPHQDIWSRFSGGSGAPFWTLAACGINPRNFTATQAAIVHCEYPLAHDSDPASLPAMIWSTNYGRLLSQTLFTLFFAGSDFAPRCIIDGKNIQDYLQSYYIEAMGQMADRIAAAGDLLDSCVIGWDSLNEPFEGLCGRKDLSVNPPAQGSTLRKGTYPTPLQGFRLGMGQAQTVENWSFGAFGPTRDGSVTIDPKGRTIWASPEDEPDGVHPRWHWKRDPGWTLGTCIWALHGIWDVETGFLMLPDYFHSLPNTDNTEAEFIEDYWKPHFTAFATRIRFAHPESILFVQPPVFARPPTLEDDVLAGRGAYSGHYYDGLTLITRHWNWFNADALGLLRGKYSSTLQAVKIGTGAIRKSLQEQLGILKGDANILGAFPTVIGEIGTPFDMDGKRSYYGDSKGRGVGDYSAQEKALDASLNAADGPNALNYTVWTYCPDSTHEWGDGWNMEDLSLWSPDDMTTPQSSLYGIKPGGSMATTALPNESEAGLMKKGAPFGVSSSANSLATITPRLTGLDAAGWRSNPYDFLTDGARAPRAFCRPWPVKLVGKQKDMAFDIAKAQFKLTVVVAAHDRLRPGAVDEEDPGTEIYVPLVHYADERLLSGGHRARQSADTASISSEENPLNSRKGSPGASTINLAEVGVPVVVDMTASTSSSGSTQVASPVSGVGGKVEIAVKELVDVDVKVSAGRWSVEGQVLRWWYDVPGPGEAEREFTIEIRRRGGVIDVKSRSGAAAAASGWCPPCTVM